MQLLKTLSEMHGAPGREEHVRAFIAGQVEKYCDEMRTDALGNLICVKRSSKADAKRVMIACHMDEIAFCVKAIDDDGFIRVQPLGGFDTRNLFARRMRIETRDGSVLFGNMNPAGKPIHVSSAEERSKVPEIYNFFVDTGLPGEEVKKRVRIGDPVTLVQEFIELGDLCTGKCMDNRVACWLGIRVLEKLKDSPYEVVVAFTVQEEIGLRGAITSAYDINPDIGIAIDVTLAVDTPGVPDDQHITKLGKGVAIKIMDASLVSDKGLVDAFIDVAEKGDIPYQLEVLPFGGTDGAALQRARNGAKAITISVPTRYVHTVTETLHKADLQASLDLLLGYLQS